MKLPTFLYDKLILILVLLITSGLGGFITYAFGSSALISIIVSSIYLFGGLAILLYEFFTRRAYYNRVFSTLDSLDKKYYISEIIEPSPFADGQILEGALRIACKSMNDEVAAERVANREYREYIELWVHEIKTPISAAMLICENKSYADVTLELAKVERLVEQVLFYARSNSVEKDYIIKQINLKKLIGDLLKKNAANLMANRIKVELPVDGEVFSDSKWLTFIIQQLLDNAIKYGAKTVSFIFKDDILTIKDDGIGILPQDLPRVFERGFSGENGRSIAKSTGMGLYLCKVLCEKLGLKITVKSENDTEISITFPQNPYVTLM